MDDAGLDVRAGKLGCGVHVRDEADGGRTLAVGGEFGIDIAVIVHAAVQTHAAQLLRQMLGQHLLLGRGGKFIRFVLRLGIVAHIIQKILDNLFHFPYPLLI